MRRVLFVIIYILFFISLYNYRSYSNVVKENNILNSKKELYIDLSNKLVLFDDYIYKYNLFVNDNLSLEEKLRELENDINTKSERVNFYRNGIDSMNSKMK